jgi:hypothetical protein
MIMTGKWMVFDGAFNDDGASASSSPIWMIAYVTEYSKSAYIAGIKVFNHLPLSLKVLATDMMF